jgi:hypothetical protein
METQASKLEVIGRIHRAHQNEDIDVAKPVPATTQSVNTKYVHDMFRESSLKVEEIRKQLKTLEESLVF